MEDTIASMDVSEPPQGKRRSRPVSYHNMVPTALAFDMDNHEQDQPESSGEEQYESGSEFTHRSEQPNDGNVTSDIEMEADDLVQVTVPSISHTPSRKGKERAVESAISIEQKDAFHRLITALSGTPHKPADAPFQSTDFDVVIKEELAALDSELQVQKTRAIRRGLPRTGESHAHTSELHDLLGEANLAYVAADHNRAIDLLTEVVRIDPYIMQPWMTLGAIYSELGNETKSLQYKIIGAHLLSKPVELWKEMAVLSRARGNVTQALYCYTKASLADRDDIDTLWDRAFLHRESGNHKAAISIMKQALRVLPHDPVITRALVNDYIELGDAGSALSTANACLSRQRFDNPHGPTSDPSAGYVIDDLVVLAELLVGSRRFTEAIRTTKIGQRWIQGREDENWWDAYADDREYDITREESRMPPAEHQEAHEDCYPLDPRLRLVLGQSRLAGSTKDKKEGKRHFDILMLGVEVEDDPQMIGDIADAYFERKLWNDAYEVYEKMSQCEMTSTSVVYAKLASCHKRLGRFEDASEVYQAIIETDPDDLESKLQLAEVYEQLGQREAALELLNAVIALRDEQGMGEDDDGFLSTHRRAVASRQRALGSQSVISRAQRAEMEEQIVQDVQRAFDLLRQNALVLAAGDQTAAKEWQDIAAFLVDNLRESKAMFPSDLGRFRSAKNAKDGRAQTAQATGGGNVDAHADDLASRIQRSLVQEEDEDTIIEGSADADQFRGVHLDEWLRVAVTYSFRCAEQGGHEEALEILQHLQTSILRMKQHRVQLLRLAIASVALHQRNYSLAVDEVRKFILAHPHQNPPLRLMQAVTPGSLAAAQVASSSIHQKFIMRQLKVISSIVDESSGGTKRRRGAEDDDEEDNDAEVPARGESAGPGENGDWVPTRGNPAYLAHYGNIMAGSKSYQAAIIYYLRAYELAPDDPLINLSLGVQYLQRAMQRQSDNRHHQISQGLAFLGRYRVLRGSCQEVDYNIGRAYHGLGLVDGAIKCYERVLETEVTRASAMPDDDSSTARESYARDAAYNLQLIYSTTGSRDLARAVARKWLLF